MPSHGHIYGTDIGMYLVISGDFYNAIPNHTVIAMEVVDEADIDNPDHALPPFYVHCDYGYIAIDRIGQMPSIMFTDKNLLGPVTSEQLQLTTDSLHRLLHTH